jgi:hypothetical protein
MLAMQKTNNLARKSRCGWMLPELSAVTGRLSRPRMESDGPASGPARLTEEWPVPVSLEGYWLVEADSTQVRR